MLREWKVLLRKLRKPRKHWKLNVKHSKQRYERLNLKQRNRLKKLEENKRLWLLLSKPLRKLLNLKMVSLLPRLWFKSWKKV